MENDNNSMIRTETKYLVTSCYFCNEFVDNNDFKSHLDGCSQALQKCPNDCLAYIQRKFMEQHLLDCPKQINGNAIGVTCDDDDGYFVLEQIITSLQSALHEEIRQRHRLIADVSSLRKTFATETENQTIAVNSLKTKINDVSQQCKEVKEWRKEFRQLLDRFSEDLEFRNDATLSLEVLFTEKDKIDSKLHTLKSEIDTLKSERKRLNDSKRSMNNLIDQSSLGQISLAPDRCRRCTFLEWKVSESLVELRQMNNIVHETEAKCAKFGKIAVDTQKLCTETKQELADLQTHFLAERKMMAISNCDGHLIWCISEFSSKLKHAKERNIVINSPIFCNQQYGYTLRMDVLLNGLGKWKGRNLLAGLSVIPGEWDALLPWPCTLKADVKLRKQSGDSPDISKTIIVRKQSNEYEQNQYVFISHRVVQTEHYLKNDCIYLEIIVHHSENHT